MRDEILAVGSTFDWISPVIGFAKDILNGPSHTFALPYDGDWSGSTISRMLGKRGVKSWGYMVVDDTLMLSVTKRQAGWTQYLLEQAGIPLDNPVMGSSGPGSMGAVRDRSFGYADDLRDILDSSIF